MPGTNYSLVQLTAAQVQEEECAMILLKFGADSNVMDASVNTALHYAIYSENVCTTANLLIHKAVMDTKSKVYLHHLYNY